jgi:uncharacterized protein (DUF1697 family)
MGKFIALLRGINVSGQKKIKMSEIKILFEDISFTNVETYIQSGNVLFLSDLNDKKTIRERLEKKIESKFGYQVQVIIKTPDELKYALNYNPFLRDKKNDFDRLYFTFLSEKPSAINIRKLREFEYPPEEYIIDGDMIYLLFPNGYGKAKMNNNFFEKKLNVFATTRNYKTVKTLFEMTKSN